MLPHTVALSSIFLSAGDGTTHVDIIWLLVDIY